MELYNQEFFANNHWIEKQVSETLKQTSDDLQGLHDIVVQDNKLLAQIDPDTSKEIKVEHALSILQSVADKKDWNEIYASNSGAVVFAVQKALVHLAQTPGGTYANIVPAGFVIDGISGDQTKQLVRNFQEIAGLQTDGLAGAKTIGVILSSFDTNPSSKATVSAKVEKGSTPKSSEKSPDVSVTNLDAVKKEVDKTIQLLGTLVPHANLKNLADSLQNLPSVDPREYKSIALLSYPQIQWSESNILPVLEKNKKLYKKLNTLTINDTTILKNMNQFLSSTKNKKLFEQEVRSLLKSPNYMFQAPHNNGWDNDLQYGYIKFPELGQRIKADFLINERYDNKKIVADIDVAKLRNSLQHAVTNSKEVYSG